MAVIGDSTHHNSVDEGDRKRGARACGREEKGGRRSRGSTIGTADGRAVRVRAARSHPSTRVSHEAEGGGRAPRPSSPLLVHSRRPRGEPSCAPSNAAPRRAPPRWAHRRTPRGVERRGRAALAYARGVEPSGVELLSSNSLYGTRLLPLRQSLVMIRSRSRSSVTSCAS